MLDIIISGITYYTDYADYILDQLILMYCRYILALCIYVYHADDFVAIKQYMPAISADIFTENG